MKKPVEKRSGGLVVLETGMQEITVFTPRVQSVATRLGWKAETVLARVKRALPTRIEQTLYLSVTAEWGVIQPETLAKLLRYFLNGQKLIEADMQERIVGEETTNKFVWVANQVVAAVSLMMDCREGAESGIAIGAETAAQLVAAYGEDGAEEIIGIVSENWYRIAEGIGWDYMSEHEATAKIIKAVAACSPCDAISSQSIIDLLAKDTSLRHWDEEGGEAW